jgi:benzoylformate decarboxylase
MTTRTVRDVVLDVLRHFEMTTIFTNPGSTEIALLTDLPDDLDFVLGLHEGTVVGMATGHALGSGRPALVVLHTTAGLGNAVGALATARTNGVPLVVVVGQQDRRHLVNEPFLAGRLQGLAGEYPVWVGEPPRAEDVAALIARAWHEAQARRGPAMVIVPMNDWLMPSDEPFELATPKRVLSGVTADPAAVLEVMACVRAATNPAIVSGSGADDIRTWDALRSIARALHAPVWQEPFGARAGFPQDSSLFAGHLPATRSGVRAALAGHDVVLVIGAASLRQYPFEPGPLFDEGTFVIGMAEDLDDIASGLLDLAVLGPLPQLCEVLAMQLGTDVVIDDSPDTVRAPRPPARSDGTLGPAQVFGALAARLTPDAVVFEESPSSRRLLNEWIPARQPLGFVSAAMGGLGFAMPAAAGLRMACPGRPVVAIVGDGSAMYNIQSLWSAQTYGLGVLYIVMSNGGYAIMDHLARMQGGKGPWPQEFGLDVCSLARGFGCRTERVETLDALDHLLDAVVTTLPTATSPLLIDVAVHRTD